MYKLKDILEWVWVLFVLVVLVVLLGAVLHEAVIEQHPITGQVTNVIESYTRVGNRFTSYLAQIDNDKYYSIGKFAGKNLMVGQCYLLRQGAFSTVYNLFEPVPCEDIDLE